MDNLWAWFVSAVGPLARKVLSSLGIGWLTFEGLTSLSAQIQSEVQAAWGLIGGDVLRMATMLGLPSALGILLGAITARIALMMFGRLGRIVA